jgi:hypothetical protein
VERGEGVGEAARTGLVPAEAAVDAAGVGEGPAGDTAGNGPGDAALDDGVTVGPGDPVPAAGEIVGLAEVA